jgi:hypothetical protein
MLARRLLALIAVLLVLLAIANAVAPRNSSPPAQPAPGTATAPSSPPQVSPAPATGGDTVTAQLSASPSGKPRTLQIRLGDEVDLAVSAPIVGTVTIAGYDLLEAVDPAAPAEFHFIADQAGTFDVSLEEADALIGRLRVRA